MLLDFQVPSELLRYPQPSRTGVEVHVPPRAVLSELYGVPAIGALEAREAHLLPELATVQKTLEGIIKSLAERLHRALRDMLAAASLETRRKIVAAKALASFLVMSLEHLQHLVVKVAALGQTGEEQSVLGAVEEKPVLESLVHLLVLLDTKTPRNGYSSCRLKVKALNPSFL